MTDRPNLVAALALIKAGFAIFPAKADKKPCVKGWQKGNRDEKKIREWWCQFPDALPAIPCGVNRLLVVDCDVKNGVDGNRAWDKACGANGLNQDACVIIDTPSGGKHFYFRQMSDVMLGNSAGKLDAGIDTRGDGGYVIAPGATLPNGHSYLLVRGQLSSIPPLPDKLDTFLRTDLHPSYQNNSAKTEHSQPRDFRAERSYALKALESEANNVASAVQGTRNTALNNAAFKIATLIENGGISRGEAEDILSQAAQKAGLGDNEIATTIASAFDAGSSKPRAPISARDAQFKQGVDLSAFKEKLDHPNNQVQAKSGLVPIRISDVTPEAITWLWPNRIAIGKLTIIAGDPGLGKSQLTAFIAACVTTGRSFPNETAIPETGDVIIFSCEDDVADTMRPRLEAADANIDRVYAINDFRGKDGKLTPVNLVEHIAEIERLLLANPQVCLVVIDPISAYLGRVDTHKNSDVRSALAPLQFMAQQHRVAVIAVAHLNKGGGNGKATNAVTGSGAFVAASRATFMVTKGQADDGLRLLVEAKNNLGKAKALAFRVESRLVCGTINAPYVAFEDGEIDVNADHVLGATSGDDTMSKLNEAVHFLRVELENGPLPTREVKKRAKDEGIADKTLTRAKDKLGVEALKEGYQGRWIWRFPFDADGILNSQDNSKVVNGPKDTHTENMDAFDQGWPSLVSNKTEGDDNDR